MSDVLSARTAPEGVSRYAPWTDLFPEEGQFKRVYGPRNPTRGSAYRALLLIAALVLLVPRFGHAIDLFGALALPPPPLQFAQDDWTASGSTLILTHTFEEFYRHWIGDDETRRFDGYRTSLALRTQLTDHLAVGVQQLIAGRQRWINHEGSANGRFDLTSNETGRTGWVRLTHRDTHLRLGWSESRSPVSGDVYLDPDIVAALGDRPSVSIDHRDRRQLTALAHPTGVWRWRIEGERGETADELTTHGIRMGLRIPLAQRYQHWSAEMAYRLADRAWHPYLRVERARDDAYGVNMRDDRFDFGRTAASCRLDTDAVGVAIGRAPRWFVEYARHHLNLSGLIKNNLITLDPLFLFGTNEIIDRERLDGTTPTTWRIGGTGRPWHGIESIWQYAQTRGELPRTSDKTTISSFRMTTVNETSTGWQRYRLHRAELQLRRRAPGGAWCAALRLMAPELITRDEPETAAALPPPGPPPPPVAAAPPPPRQRTRGGWQLTVGRELSW